MGKIKYSVVTSMGQRKNLSPDGNQTHDLPYTGCYWETHGERGHIYFKFLETRVLHTAKI